MDLTKLRIVLRTAYLFCFVNSPCRWFFFFFFPNSLCFTTLKQGFMAPPRHSSAHALRLGRSFIRQGISLLAFYSEKAALQYFLEC